MEPEPALQVLRRRIKEEHDRMNPPREVWFWLSGHALASRGRGWVSAEKVAGVKGFMGTAPVIFAGLNPSLKDGPQGPYDSDEFFYGALAEHNLHDAHVTDIFKVRCRRKDVCKVLYAPPLVTLHRDWFVEEVGIIQPAFVVTMGAEVLDVLLNRWHLVLFTDEGQYAFQLAGGTRVPVVTTYHPSSTSYASTRPERQARIRRDCARVRELLADTL